MRESNQKQLQGQNNLNLISLPPSKLMLMLRITYPDIRFTDIWAVYFNGN